MRPDAAGEPAASGKTALRCPCGVLILAANEDELVEKALEHLRDAHPEHAERYSREQILFLAF